MIAAFALGACKVGTGPAADAKDKDGKDKGPDAVPVEVVKAERRAIAASYTNTAALEARSQATVTARASGIVKRVFVDVGSQVRVGQPLVQLDTDRPRLALIQAEAQMRKLEANYARAQQLIKQQMVSNSDLDELRYNLDNARAQYNTAKLELDYTPVTAPISGVVSNRPASIKPGNLVQFGQDVVTIVDVSRLEATLNVPEREIAKLKPGQKVQLTADALPGKAFDGVVDRVSPVVDSGTFRVIAVFDGGGELQPGMFSRLSINYDQRADALVVPRNALLEDGGEPAVYVVRDGKALRTGLKLGYDDAGWVEVREGLKLGDAVVVAGKAALREGSAVQVLGGKAADGKATAPAAQAAKQ